MIASMQDLAFVFGPNRSYWFWCGGSARSSNIPVDLIRYGNNIRQPLCVALGPKQTEFFAIYFSKDPACKSRYICNLSSTLPLVHSWIRSHNIVLGTTVAIGPSASFVALSPEKGTYHWGIPASLAELLASDTKGKVSQVTLGAGGAWAVVWENGVVDWEIWEECAELKGILEGAAKGDITYISLNPYTRGQYFLAFEDGSARYCLPTLWATEVQKVIVEFQSQFLNVTSSFVAGGKAVLTAKMTTPSPLREGQREIGESSYVRMKMELKGLTEEEKIETNSDMKTKAKDEPKKEKWRDGKGDDWDDFDYQEPPPYNIL